MNKSAVKFYTIFILWQIFAEHCSYPGTMRHSVHTEYLKIRFKSRNLAEAREMQRKSGLNRCPSSTNN